MKNLHKSIFLMLIFLSAFHQSNAQTPTPTITPEEIKDYDVTNYENPPPSTNKFSIKLPMGKVYAGEIIDVRVESSVILTTSSGNSMYPFRWEITGGTIIGDSDKPKIQVKTDENSSRLSARVEIVEFYGIESDYASDEIELLKKPKSLLFAEINYKSSNDDRNILIKFNEFSGDLKKQPTDKGLIIIRIKKSNTAKKIEKLIKDYAREKNLDLNNTTIKRILDKENYIRFYTVPSGAEIPSW